MYECKCVKLDANMSIYSKNVVLMCLISCIKCAFKSGILINSYDKSVLLLESEVVQKVSNVSYECIYMNEYDM